MTAWSGPLLLLIGLSSWLAVNSVFSYLGYLIANTPEGAALPSVLTVALQIPNVVALAIGWFASSSSKRKTGADSRSHGAAGGSHIIDNLLVLGCIGLASIAQVMLATGLWKATSTLAGGRRSVLLVVLVAVAGIADTSSSVLFWPLAARPAFAAQPGDLPPTVWLAIGEGLSSVIPNALALVQFAGLRDGQHPRLSEEVFFACMACVHLVSLAAASALLYGEQGVESCCAAAQAPNAPAGAPPRPGALPSSGASSSNYVAVSGTRHPASESLAGIHPDPHRTGLLAADPNHILECASVPLGSGNRHTDPARIHTAASAPAQLPSPAADESLHPDQQGQGHGQGHDRTQGAAPAPTGLMDALSRDGCSMALLAVASALQNALLFSALPFATSVAGSSRGAARAYLYANTLGGIADPIGAGLAAALGAGGCGASGAGAWAWAWVWAPGLVAAWVVPSLAVLALAVGPVRGCDHGGGGGGAPVPPGCVVLAVGVGACFVAARGLLALVRAGAFGRLASMDRDSGDGNRGGDGGAARGETGQLEGLPYAFSRAGGMVMQAAAGCASVAGFLLLTVAGLGVESSS